MNTLRHVLKIGIGALGVLSLLGSTIYAYLENEDGSSRPVYTFWISIALMSVSFLIINVSIYFDFIFKFILVNIGCILTMFDKYKSYSVSQESYSQTYRRLSKAYKLEVDDLEDIK